jgi:hypothetical protein
MHKKPSQEHQSSQLHTKVTQTLNWLKGFITTVPIAGSCLALLYLVTGEQVVGFLLAVSLIMYLIAGMVYQITMMKIYGWHLRVEVLVDIGVTLGVTVYLLLTGVVLLVQFLSYM